MKKILKIISNNNESTIRNTIDGSDDTCWFSNGANPLLISLFINEEPEYIFIEFQTGFQPKIIEIPELSITYKIKSSENTVKLDVKKKKKDIDIYFKDGYDPYNRICVYNISVE